MKFDHRWDGVRAMTAEEVHQVSSRMRSRDHTCFRELFWHFLDAFTFHNLELLAGCSPRDPEQCIRAVAEGRGGPCHVAATGFLSLLRALGYNAHLAAATIGAPGDHVVVMVEVDGERVVADVGNGHPYLVPFPLKGEVAFAHHGWRFQARGDGARVVLTRTFEDQRTKQVYCVDATPRTFDDFQNIIDCHHEQEGFGPFLSGVRASRVGDELIVTLRDFELTRYSVAGVRRRRVLSRGGLERVLTRVFDLDSALVDSALSALTPTAPARVREAPPRFLVSLSTTGRPDNLERLLESLSTEWSRTHASVTDGMKVATIIVENSPEGRDRVKNRALIARHGDSAWLDIEYVDDGTHGRPIAASRTFQTRLIARSNTRSGGHDIVWMIDDDIEFAQLRVVNDRLVRDEQSRYFEHIVELFHHSPEVSVMNGGYCGDPPIRPEAILATQTLDLCENLERFMRARPEEMYEPNPRGERFQLPDYYYDHSRAGTAHLYQHFAWLSRGPSPTTVAEEALVFLSEMRGISWGKTPTRPLLFEDDARSRAHKTYCIRGGNTVFLDIDACLRHVYPSLDLEGATTRRADMIGSSLLARETGTWVIEFPYRVMHCRDPFTLDALTFEAQRARALTSLMSEHFGVMIARAVMDGAARAPLSSDAIALLSTHRVARIVDGLQLAASRIARARALIVSAVDGWMGHDLDASRALEELDATLATCEEVYLGGAGQKAQAAWRERIRAALDVPGAIDAIAAYARTGIYADIEAHMNDIHLTIEQERTCGD